MRLVVPLWSNFLLETHSIHRRFRGANFPASCQLKQRISIIRLLLNWYFGLSKV